MQKKGKKSRRKIKKTALQRTKKCVFNKSSKRIKRRKSRRAEAKITSPNQFRGTKRIFSVKGGTSRDNISFLLYTEKKMNATLRGRGRSFPIYTFYLVGGITAKKISFFFGVTIEPNVQWLVFIWWYNNNICGVFRSIC